jgi:chemotaxis protein CheX
VDVRFVNPVLDSIVNVLVTMANMEPRGGRPVLKPDNKAQGVITGVIDMASSQANGSIAISFSQPAALEITKRMLRIEPHGIDDMVEDLVGEIANMMAGGAKAKLQEQGYDFDLSLPSVVVGEGHVVQHRFEGRTIVLPFATDAGEFFVEVCFP